MLPREYDDQELVLAQAAERIRDLEAALGQLQRTMESWEHAYLKEHGHWGHCTWRLRYEHEIAQIKELDDAI